MAEREEKRVELTGNNIMLQKCSSQSPEKSLDRSDSNTFSCSTGNLNGAGPAMAILKNNGGYLSDSNNNVNSKKVTQKKYSSEIPKTTDEIEEEYDGLIHVDEKNANNTLQMLNVLRKNRQLCDLILQLDDDSQDIYCHQIILACNSKFFMEIFNNYNIEQANTNKSTEDLNGSKDDENPKKHSKDHHSNRHLSTDSNNIKKNSLQTIVNTNLNSTHRQLLFCLSDYLRNFLSDNYHHHYAKMNSIINHNSNYHHHHHNIHNHHSMNVSNVDQEEMHRINQNLDYEALKICIDYMYKSVLKVPSYLLPHVYTLAYHLSFENIVQACAEHLTKHLNVDNCLSIRSFALDENLIQSSTQCIEKNIEYILQLKTNFRSSSNSLNGSTNKLNGYPTNNENNEHLSSNANLSSSLNLANKEFNHLPRINIQIVGLMPNKCKLPDNLTGLTQLSMNWLIEELVEKHDHTLNDLTSHLNMLYMNTHDQTLHDCCEMDSSDCNFNDYINDYQKQHVLISGQATNTANSNARKNSSRCSPTGQQNGNVRLKTFKITDQELNAIGTATPIKLKILHDNEVICTHQTGETSFVIICTLTGKLVNLRIQIIPCAGNSSNSENNEEIKLASRKSSNTDSTIVENLGLFEKQVSNGDLHTGESQFSLDQQNNKYSNNPKTQNYSAASVQISQDADRLPKMSVARASHGVISYGKKLYIIGGYDRGECLDMCEVYNPVTNLMENIEKMESRRGRASIVWFENTNSIYALGGSDGHEDLNSIECYNFENNSWRSIKFDFDLSFTNLGAVACKNFIYLVGLKGDGGKSLSRSSCLKYEPSTNSFKRIGELNNGRSQSALVCSNNFLFVFGGHDQIKCLSSCEVYNIQEDKWTMIPSMIESRRGCGAAVHEASSTIYIVGGTNGGKSLKSVEIYDIKSTKWTMGPDLNIARTNVAIAFIGDILFAVGGFDGKTFLKTIEYLNCNDLSNGWSLYHKTSDFESIA